jgi:hypothetical protein
MHFSRGKKPNPAGTMNRRRARIAALVIAALCVPFGATATTDSVTLRSGSVLRGVDLPGKDYRHFAARSYRSCRTTCNEEARCEAWTFVEPGVQGPDGVCWLKREVPAQRRDARTISGTKSAIGEEAFPLTLRPGGTVQPQEGTGANRTTRDHRRRRVPTASLDLECDDGKTYTVSTGNSKGECTPYIEADGSTAVFCDDKNYKGEQSWAKAECGGGCVGSGGSGSCHKQPSG